MVLERLLDGIPRSKFYEEYFLRLPFSLTGGAKAFSDLATWATVEALFEHPDADVLITRDGRRWEGEAAPPFEQARRLFDEGYTLLVRHAERHDARLEQLARDFRREFHAPIDVHLYCTPGGRHGFGWHYDAEDVFIVQTAGSKEYSLRKNTVDPWPLAEALPADMRYERELMPMLKCLLGAGDWLYIPNGYWHCAHAEVDSISIAVGVMSTTALDAFDYLRRRLLSSMLWRQRLPVIEEDAPTLSAEQIARHREIFAELGDDLSRAFQDEGFVRSFLSSRRIAHAGETTEG